MYFHLVERPNKEVWGAISFGSEPVTTTVVLPSAHLREIAEQTPEKLIEMADECDRLNSAIITPKRNASLIVPGKGN